MKDENSVRFLFPRDGDCLNEYDGIGAGKTIAVKLSAPENADLWVAGKRAEKKPGGECAGYTTYTADIPLSGYKTILSAINRKTGDRAEISVFCLEKSIGYCRISVDDGILFLQDITEHKAEYRSIFDNPYLALFKEAHDIYGANVQINLFYESKESDRTYFSKKRADFNLSQMTDQFKDEWRQNADWLKLSFHGKSNFPDSPYKHAAYDQLAEDIEAVHREIFRFASAAVLPPVTTLHWGAANEAGVRALRDAGYRGLCAYFEFDGEETLVSYACEKNLVSHMQRRDFWRDDARDIVFAKTDMVINGYRLEGLIPALDEIYADKHKAGFIELLIHEQYFYDDYRYFLWEYRELVLSASKWLTEHDYTFAHLDEVMFQ